MFLWDKIVQFHNWSKQYCLCRYFKAWWGKPTGVYKVTHTITFNTSNDGTPDLSAHIIKDMINDMNTKMNLGIIDLNIKSKAKELRS